MRRYNYERYYFVSFLYYAKQKDAILPCVCSVKDHNRRRTVVRTSVTFGYRPVLPHFDVICDQLVNRRTETWNLFVKVMAYQLPRFNRKKLQKCPIQKRQPCEPRPVADLSFLLNERNFCDIERVPNYNKFPTLMNSSFGVFHIT